jgi:CheY-like chemotaxis protein
MKSRSIKTLQRQITERVRQLDDVRSRFLAASHDLRQPLHALGLFVAQLRGLPGDSEQKQIVERIDRAVSALNERFSELLELSRAGAGGAHPGGSNMIADALARTLAPAGASPDRTNGKLVVVIDDDPLVLGSTGGLLRGWGCTVVAGSSGGDALDGLPGGVPGQQRSPDLIISDFRLSDGKTGIDAIAEIRGAFPDAIPAFLVSGDTSPQLLHDARAHGLHLLHKPVNPMTLRAMLNRMLRARQHG